MPEFYDQGTCKYQRKAQPYLAAIASGVRDDTASRSFLLEGTEFARAYAGAKPLWQEQWKRRDASNSLQCPFWSNYWYEPCGGCNCRINNSVSMEVDAIFFLESAEKNTLAVHVEMKLDREKLSVGQAEAYRPRAACFRDQRRERKTLLPHHHFVTVLFCGLGTVDTEVRKHFDRLIEHDAARKIFPGYPQYGCHDT